MQRDFSFLDLSTLYDLLANYTIEYTRILKSGGPANKFKNYETLILILQEAIEAKKNRNQETMDSDSIPAIA